MLIFEWDKNKAAENYKKHKIDFDEATTVFITSAIKYMAYLWNRLEYNWGNICCKTVDYI